MTEDVVRRAPDLRSFRLGDAEVVWHRGRLHQLDGPAAAIWRLVDGTRSASAIGDALAREVSTDSGVVRRDVEAFLETLAGEGLLDPGADPKPVLRSPLSLRSTPYTGPGPIPPGIQQLPVWADRSPTYTALGRRFSVLATDAHLTSRLRRTLRSMEDGGGPAEHQYAVVSTDAGYEIYLDDRGVNTAPSQDQALRHVLWHINSEAIRTSDGHVLVHGAAAASNAGAIVFPGSINAGKTTLVTGLALAGFPVLTDELVALRVDGTAVDAYPRPFNIGVGSWPALPEVVDHGELTRSPDGVPELLHLAPGDIPGARVAESAVPAAIVLPHFEEGSSVDVRPVDPGEALRALVEQSMNLDAHQDRGVEVLVELARCCPTYALRHGCLRDAVNAVRKVVNSLLS